MPPADAAQAVTPAPISTVDKVFRTFTAKGNINSGLAVLLDRGDGNFELVMLADTAQKDMASEEVGERIKTSPGSLEIFKNVQAGWTGAKLNLDLAINSAARMVFRFEKLPKEIRYMVYDLTIKSGSKRVVLSQKGDMGINILHVNKAIREEALSFFYRNTFIFESTYARAYMRVRDIFLANVQRVEITWYASPCQTARLFVALANAPQLEVLNIVLGKRMLDTPAPRTAELHRNASTHVKFTLAPGYDSLIELRGLKSVTVHDPRWDSKPLHQRRVQIAKSEIKAFEDFLNGILTQPKTEQPLVKKPHGRKKAKVENNLRISPAEPKALEN